MEEVTKKTRRRLFILLSPEVLVAGTGLFLSVALHELFHLLMHVGHITGVGFFTSPGAIVDIHSNVPHGYDLNLEETVAYSITMTVIIVTTMLVWKIHDKKDTRSYSQILFPETASS